MSDYVVGALVTGAFVIGTAALTHWFSDRSDKRRTSREATARAQDRAEAVRARLHRDRIDAYKEFRLAYRTHAARHEEMARGWQARKIHGEEVGALSADAPIDERNRVVRLFDAVHEEYRRASAAASLSASRLQDALVVLEMVASDRVADAARTLQGRATGETQARLQLGALNDPDGLLKWNAVQKAQADVEAANEALVEAIRSELQRGIV